MSKRKNKENKMNNYKNKKNKKTSNGVIKCYECLGNLFFISYAYLNENEKIFLKIPFIEDKKYKIVARKMIKNLMDIFEICDYFCCDISLEIFDLCLSFGIITKKDVEDFRNNLKFEFLACNKNKIEFFIKIGININEHFDIFGNKLTFYLNPNKKSNNLDYTQYLYKLLKKLLTKGLLKPDHCINTGKNKIFLSEEIMNSLCSDFTNEKNKELGLFIKNFNDFNKIFKYKFDINLILSDILKKKGNTNEPYYE